MISLKKYLVGPWELVRHSLIEDLESIESAVNTNWHAAFTPGGVLKPSAFDASTLDIPETPEPAGSKLAKHRFCGGL
jgi:hypothetical protein